jgi:riboflavin kinase/FMN adenylyltransferase
VHRGHQAVIREALARARAAGRPGAVVTFEPHPRRFFRPDQPPFLLTRLRTRLRVLAGLGVEIVHLLRFAAALAAVSAEDFVDDVLVRRLDLARAVVGYDFVFGHGRRGTPELLRARLAAAGRAATVVSPVARPGPAGVDDEGSIYSSTGVRDALVAGDPAAAAALLGRRFEIEGRVARGDRRGRTIGFPTANLWLGELLRPRLGVYAVRARIDAEPAPVDGVANLGLRPTFGGDREPRLEVHLFGLDRDLYGRRLAVELAAFLRPERRFDGVAQLRAQIEADAAAARAALAAQRGMNSTGIPDSAATPSSTVSS